MAKLDRFESYDDARTVKRLLDGTEFNGGTIVCAIYNDEEEARERANGRPNKEKVGRFQRFPQTTDALLH